MLQKGDILFSTYFYSISVCRPTIESCTVLLKIRLGLVPLFYVTDSVATPTPPPTPPCAL